MRLSLLLLLMLAMGIVHSAPLRVVVVHSYHHDYPWTRSQHQGFTQTLGKLLPGRELEYSVEYLDTKRTPLDALYQGHFFDYLLYKYRGFQPDLIYLTDDDALAFYAAYGERAFADTPVFYSGINDLAALSRLPHDRFAGVPETKDVATNLELLSQLDPAQKRLLVVGDGSSTDAAIRASIAEQLTALPRFEPVFIAEPQFDTLMARIDEHPGEVLLLASIGALKDNAGGNVPLDRALATIAHNRWVISMEDTYVAGGVLGGYVTSGRTQGAAAATLAARYVAGTPMAQLKLPAQSPNEYLFDFPALAAHGVSLPTAIMEQATLRNSPRPLTERYARHLLAAVIILATVVLGALALFLLALRRKNRLIKARSQALVERDEVIRQQLHDPLTDLPNRLQLLKDIDAARNPLMALLNVDRFNDINNFYGLEVGDGVIRRVAETIAGQLAGNARLYRVGGDEFAVLIPRGATLATFEPDLEAILESFDLPLTCQGGQELHISLTAGIAVGADRLFLRASMALRHARELKRNLRVFDDSLLGTSHHEENLKWTSALKRALADDRIVPYFQPIAANHGSGPPKYEALARLIDDDGKVISPFFFLDIARRARLYPLITRRITEKALAAAEEHAIHVSINLSVEDLRNAETVRFLRHALARRELAERIVLELTESEGIEDYGEVLQFVADMKGLGCRIAIDDFGSGYSNFVYLAKLGADFIKIDGSIIKNVCDDPNSQLLTRTLVEFARELGMETVAEFVSSEEILTKVTELGVDYSQGFLLGKPEATPQPVTVVPERAPVGG